MHDYCCLQWERVMEPTRIDRDRASHLRVRTNADRTAAAAAPPLTPLPVVGAAGRPVCVCDEEGVSQAGQRHAAAESGRDDDDAVVLKEFVHRTSGVMRADTL